MARRERTPARTVLKLLKLEFNSPGIKTVTQNRLDAPNARDRSLRYMQPVRIYKLTRKITILNSVVIFVGLRTVEHLH